MKLTKVKNNDLRLCYENNEKIIRILEYKDKKVIFSGSEEFIIFFTEDKEEKVIKSSEMICDIKNDGNSLKIFYKIDDIIIDVIYKLDDNIIKKNIEIKSTKTYKIKRILCENMSIKHNLSRGGEGQPVFIDNIMWCGMEHPVALNEYREGVLQFVQNPFITISKNKSFKCFEMVFGFNTSDSLEKTFYEYIKKISIQNDKPLKIYCDWGMHDEMSDKLDLNEKMSFSIIDFMKEMKDDYDVKFDYYLMDAFWFEENQAYIKYKSKTFPQGIGNVLKRLKDNDIKYGLWFDINFIHSKIQGLDANKRLPDNNALCFACQDINQLMEKALIYHIKQNNVKMFKFDFAYFDCNNPDHNDIHSNILKESKEVSISAFIEMINRIREIDPEIKILAYNGWSVNNEFMGNVQDRKDYVISPYWAKHIDYLYCGDPRPSEIATIKLSDSIIYYTDSMIRYFYNSLMPLKNIDDHGTMFGNTGTIYWINKEGLYKSLIMNIMRGNQKFHLYGDVGLLTEEDKKYIKFVDNIYDDIIKNNMQTEIILGNPILRQVYGYSNYASEKGYVAIVNPSSTKENFYLELNEWKTNNLIKTKILFRNKKIETNDLSIYNGLCLEMEPDEVLILYWELSNFTNGKNLYKATLDSGCSMKIFANPQTQYITLNFYEDNKPKRSGYALPEGITIEHKGKEECIINQQIWSGSSWQTIKLNGQKYLMIKNQSQDSMTFEWEERL